MTPINEIPAVCNYGTSAVYSNYPSPEQLRAGVVPLDSLPAAWWNKMWCASNCAINEARDMVGQLITELNSVLAQAGVCPQSACTDQLYQSINLIRQRLATASTPGSVVSSSTASEVAVDPTTGRMTVNCLGNAASLTTSASTIVGAINELKSTYDCCFSDTATAISGKAPTSHASSATTYGVGNADNYGHLKISDTYTSVLSACSGVAASQKALACVYAIAAAAAAGNVSLGNTAGCALGTAAAGTAITAARSDHVHPIPTCVACAGQSYCVMDYYANTTPLYLGYAGTGLTCAQVTHLAAFSTNYTTGKTVIKDVAKSTVQSWLGLGSAAYANTSDFRPSTWTPASVAALSYTGAGNGVVTAYQASTAYCGSAAEWASYLIFNHGDGSTYYNQMIRMPFGGVPQYQRKSNGTNSGWKTFITSENIASQSVKYADCAARNSSGSAFGSAAVCAASAFRPSTWWPDSLSCGCVATACYACRATDASGACYARCHYVYTTCLRVYTTGSNCTGWGDMILCNFSNAPVRVIYPWLLDWTKGCYNASCLANYWSSINRDTCVNSYYYNFNCGSEIRTFLERVCVIPAGFCVCFYTGSLSRVFCIPTVAYY